MTQAVQATNAAQYYQLGLQAYERKYFLDALVMLERARRLAPDNAGYQAAYEQIQILAISLGGWFSKKSDEHKSHSFSAFCCECCADGGCECCCEACSLFGDNCDCDCG